MTVGGLQMYQFIIVSLAAYMIVVGAQKYIQRQPGQSLLKLLVRLIVWGGMAVIALFPMLTNRLAEIIGLEGNINAVILTGFLLVFLLIFKILSVVERLEQNISDLTRKDALSGLPKNHENKGSSQD